MTGDKPIIISACLAGYSCRYDGRHKEMPYLKERVKRGEVIPLCPEQLGGLPTPRSKAQIEGGDGLDVLSGKARVVDENGMDVTRQFLRGADEVLKLARDLGAVKALLCDGSPSCGPRYIRRGAGVVEGMGVCAALLLSERIVIEAPNRKGGSG